MKIGIRKPSLKKSIKARTTGRIERSIKSSVNPLYGKKGFGLITNPKKAIYNKIYNKTSVSILKPITSIFLKKGKCDEHSEINNNLTDDVKQSETVIEVKEDGGKNKIVSILRWTGFGFLVFMALGCLLTKNPISAILHLLVAFGISPLFDKYLSYEGFRIKKAYKNIGIGVAFAFAFFTFIYLGETSNSTADNVEEVVSESNLEQADVVETEVVETAGTAETSIDEVESQETIVVPKTELVVHYIDIGQGDCTLVESQNQYMLIDAGPDDCGTKIQKYLLDNGVSKLDYLVLTHPDSDHIGGADVIVTKFDIDYIFMSSFISNNKDYEKLLDALSGNKVWQIPKTGDSFDLGDAKVTFIQSREYKDSNNSSLCLKVECGETSFLFAGDAENQAEKDMIDSGVDLASTVYHVSHHGSYTSTSKEFLDAINPSYAVISCGKDNEFGHPHQEILDELRVKNVALFRTDLQGGIDAFSDGEKISWNVTPEKEYVGGSSELEKRVKTAELASLNEKDSSKSNQEAKADSDSIDTLKVAEAAVVGTIIGGEAQKSNNEENAVADNTPPAVTNPDIPQAAPGNRGVGSGPSVTVPDVAESGPVMVWIPTNGGKKYHTNPSCSGMENPMEVSIDQAVANGFTPCKRCH